MLITARKPGVRMAAVVAALGLAAGACGGRGVAATPMVHDGPVLGLAAAVTVDSGKVHAPALAWDPASKKLYAAWVRDSAAPGPYGGQLGIPYVASSADGGWSWSTPVRVTANEAANAQSPQVLTVTKAGTLVDVWANYRADPSIPTGGEYQLEVARSADEGASFKLSSPGDGGVQQVSRPNVTTTPDGRVWLAWLDGRPVDQTGDYLFNVALKESHDDGKTFTPGWVVKGNACQCCRPALAQPAGDPNTLAVIWRDVVFKPGTENHPMQMDGMDPDGKNHPGQVYAKTDDRRIKVAVSHDGGHDFGPATSVNDFDWYLQACPTIGPSIFYDSTGKTMGVAWFNGAPEHTGVYYTRSTDGGATFSAPAKLTDDIVAEGYDLVANFDTEGNAWVGWGAAGEHLQLARISPTGEVRKTEKIPGERIGMTFTETGPVLSYADPDHEALVTRHVTL
ncbi:MAG: hypothetical protein ACRDTX_24830 [Pseudonocardiaceae bacterium]